VVAASVVEANKKAASETALPGTDKPAAAPADQKATVDEKTVKPLFETAAKDNGKQEVKPDLPQQQPQSDDAKVKPDASSGNTLIKTVTELKEALMNAVAQPQAPAADAASTANTAKTSHLSYLYNERAVPDKAVLHQIVSKFQLLTGQHGSEIRVQLKPDQLGSIKISVEVNNDVVSTRMQVENEKVKHIIENNVQMLKSALEESGIKVEKFEVTVDQGRDDFFHRELSEQGKRVRGMLRTQVSGQAGGGDGITEDLTAETGRRYGYNTVEFVG